MTTRFLQVLGDVVADFRAVPAGGWALLLLSVVSNSLLVLIA